MRTRNAQIRTKNQAGLLFPLRKSAALLAILLLVLAALDGCAHRSSGAQDQGSKSVGRHQASANSTQERARAWFHKGLEAKDLADKERYYLEALRERPGYPEAHNNLGDVYEKQGKYDEALREYQIAVALVPSFAPAWFGIGDVSFALGYYEAAVHAYEKGLALEAKDELARHRLRIAQTLTMAIHFAVGSADLTHNAKAKLREVAAALQQPDAKDAAFEVQGHADSTGSATYNQRLSLERARRVRDFVARECGIEPPRLVAKGYGEDRPMASNETGEGRAMNRRVQVAKQVSRAGSKD